MRNRTETGCRPDQLIGMWVIHDYTLIEQALAIDPLLLLAEQRQEEAREAAEADPVKRAQPKPPFTIAEEGIARVDITGPMTKRPTSYNSMFGGTSTIEKREVIRGLKDNKDIKQVALVIDSPGGTVIGTGETADDVRALRAVKPVHTYFEDCGASAAYWVGSQANTIAANRTALVGSLGTMTHLIDSSGSAERKGIIVRPISTSEFKTTRLPGAPISAAQIADEKRRVTEVNQAFIEDVAKGRDPTLSLSKVKALFDGKVHVAPYAKQLGLIDYVESYEQFLSRIKSSGSGHRTTVVNPAASFTAPSGARSPAMLTAQQLQQARQITGVADVSEETASPLLLEAYGTLETERDALQLKVQQLTPKAVDPEALRDRAEIAIGRLDLSIDRGDMPKFMGDKLKSAVRDEKGNPNAFMLTYVSELNARPVEFITNLFTGSKAGVSTGQVSGAQAGSGTPKPRITPGADDDRTEEQQHQAKLVEDAKTKTNKYVEDKARRIAAASGAR